MDSKTSKMERAKAGARTRLARLATPVTSRHLALGRSVHDATLQRGLASTAWRFGAGFR